MKFIYVIACLCQKRGGTWAIFIYYWMNSGKIHLLCALGSIHDMLPYQYPYLTGILSTHATTVILNSG